MSVAAPLLAIVGAPGSGAVNPGLLWQRALFFGKAGAFVFGSGLAIVPFLYAGCVKELGWLDNRQFLDAVAVAMIKPGPVVITFTVIPAPHFKRWGKRPDVLAFVHGVTAAATGAIAGAVIVLVAALVGLLLRVL